MPEALSTIAELGIGISGFTGVVVAIGFGRTGLRPLDRYRVLGLLFGSFGAALLAVLPIVLDDAGVAPVSLWRASSAVFVLYLVGFLAYASTAPRSLSDADRRGLHPAMWIFAVGGQLVALPFLAWNALAGASSVPYLGALYYLLVYSSLQFLRLLLVRPSVQDQGR